MTEITLVPLVEGEYLSTALQTENPNLRIEFCERERGGREGGEGGG